MFLFWLCWVFIAPHGLSRPTAYGILSLVTRDRICISSTARQILNQWTTSGVSEKQILNIQNKPALLVSNSTLSASNSNLLAHDILQDTYEDIMGKSLFLYFSAMNTPIPIMPLLYSKISLIWNKVAKINQLSQMSILTISPKSISMYASGKVI